MRGALPIALALLNAMTGMAATSGFLLGVDYGEWSDSAAPVQMATDASGDLYILAGSIMNPSPSVTKLSADGKTILWKRALDGVMAAMAVDPAGNVYLVPALVSIYQPLSVFVEKISVDGTMVVWRATLDFDLPTLSEVQPTIAVDSAGRAYVAGYDDTKGGYVVRLNAAGAVDYTTSVNGVPSSIAVDQAGAAYIAGTGPGLLDANSVAFLKRFAPDGSAGYSLNFPQMFYLFSFPPSIAADLSGNVFVLGLAASGNAVLERVDP